MEICIYSSLCIINANFHFIKTISIQNFLNRFLTFKANHELGDTSPFSFPKFTMNKLVLKVFFVLLINWWIKVIPEGQRLIPRGYQLSSNLSQEYVTDQGPLCLLSPCLLRKWTFRTSTWKNNIKVYFIVCLPAFDLEEIRIPIKQPLTHWLD